MDQTTGGRRMIALWNRVTDYTAPDPIQARRGRWLNRFFLAQVTLTLFVLLVGALVPASGILSTWEINMVFGVVALGLYLLNRRGYTSLAATGLLFIMLGATLFPTQRPGLDLPGTFLSMPFLAINIMIAGTFLSWRLVPLMVLLGAVYAAWYFAVSPVPVLVEFRQTTPNSATAMALVFPLFYMCIGVLAWLSNRLISETLTDLRRQNDDLAAANQTIAAQERLRSELDIARTIQQQLLPATLPVLPGLEIAAVCRPAQETSGDSYDVLAGPNGGLYVILSDACGKSVPAALLIALSRNTLRAALGHSADPGSALSETNRALAPDLNQRQFVAISCALIDPVTHRLQLANAGQVYPALVRRAATGGPALCTFLETPSPRLPVGIVPDLGYESISVPLEPGDLLICYSDGLTDAINAAGEPFGFDRLADLLCARAAQGASAPAVMQALLDAASAWESQDTPRDDITIVALRLIPESPG